MRNRSACVVSRRTDFPAPTRACMARLRHQHHATHKDDPNGQECYLTCRIAGSNCRICRCAWLRGESIKFHEVAGLKVVSTMMGLGLGNGGAPNQVPKQDLITAGPESGPHKYLGKWVLRICSRKEYGTAEVISRRKPSL